MQPLYKLKDYKETFKFEREHPKALRWDDKYKLFMLTQEEKCQGIWLRDKNYGLIAEIIGTWNSDNVLHICSITVLPEFRRQGHGAKLIQLMSEWAENMGFEWMTGEARKITSWNVFENQGAAAVFEHKNWGGCGETYMFFKMEI